MIDTETKIKLQVAMEICYEEDRSTEYMIQFMQDSAGVSHEVVLEYLGELEDKQRSK